MFANSSRATSQAIALPASDETALRPFAQMAMFAAFGVGLAALSLPITAAASLAVGLSMFTVSAASGCASLHRDGIPNPAFRLALQFSSAALLATLMWVATAFSGTLGLGWAATTLAGLVLFASLVAFEGVASMTLLLWSNSHRGNGDVSAALLIENKYAGIAGRLV